MSRDQHLSGAAVHHTRTTIALFVCLFSCTLALHAQTTDSDDFREQVRNRVEALAPVRDGEWVLAVNALPRFYERRAYAPAWIDSGEARQSVGQLLQAIERAAGDGLRPEHYHLNRLRELVDGGAARTTSGLVELEIRATDAFLVLASHLVAGRINPESLHSEWVAVRREADPVRQLAVPQRHLRPGCARTPGARRTAAAQLITGIR